MSTYLETLGPALLFCPGDRPERFPKAAAAADLAILDLEDGVAASEKEKAREAVVTFLGGGGHAGLRINLPQSERGRADLEALAGLKVPLILLPKTETMEELDDVAERTDAPLIASIETARGLLAIEAIAAHPAVGAISWGPYDLAADMGLRAVRHPDGSLLPPLSSARDRLIVAAAAHRKRAIDTVTAELKDTAVIASDVANAALLGFRGKFAIHPSQVPLIRDGFRPTATEVERAQRMLEAIGGEGVMIFEGEMVDEPMLARARSVIAASKG